MRLKKLFWLSSVSVLLFSPEGRTQGEGVTYHGRLLNPDGKPVVSSSVQFRLQIRTPLPTNCLLYEETQTKDLSQSQGVFSVTLNDDDANQANQEPFTLATAFQNQGKLIFPASKCTGNNEYSPNASDGRRLLVFFNDGNFSGWEPLPVQNIAFVPMALEAMSVGGHQPKNFFRVQDPLSPLEVIDPWTFSNYQKLLDLVTNTTISGGNASIGGNAAGFTGSLVGDVTGTQAATKVEKIQGNAVLAGTPSDKQVLTWSHANSRWEPANVPVAGSPDWNDIVNKPTGTANGQVLQYDTSLGWKADKLLYTDLVKAGGGSPWPSTPCVAGEAIIWQSATDGFECAPISITEADPTVKGFAKNDPSSDFSTPAGVLTLNTVPITRGGTGAVSQSAAINNLLPSQSGQANKILQTNGTNVSWVDAPASGVTSINGATGSSQTFTVAQGETAPVFKTSGNTHTLNIPEASTSGVTAGTISYTDYQTFSGKQNALGFTPLNPANNLSELASATTARTNLGLGTAATKNFGTGNGNLVELDGSGRIPASLLPSQSGTYFVQGGNAFSAPAVLGTTDAQPLHLQTGGTNKVTVLSNGNVGIGTTGPSGILHVNGGTAAASTDGTNITFAAQNAGTGNKSGGNIFLTPGSKSGTGAVGAVVVGSMAPPSYLDSNSLFVQGNVYATAIYLDPGKEIGWNTNSTKINAAGYDSTADYLAISTNSIERFRISGTGNVGIGTTTLGAQTRLYVNGQIASASGEISTGAIDFSIGNSVTTSFDCGTAFTLANLRNGGTYILVVTGAGTTQCQFPSNTTGDDAASVTYKWQAPNAVRTAGSHTMYTLVRIGDIIYVSWATGFQ